jgi:peptide/nickel transport system ATP-binding protein
MTPAGGRADAGADESGRRPEGDVLTVDSLSVNYRTGAEPVRALRDVSLHIDRGETLGVAGESGSGKSTLALAVLRYLDENGRVVDGAIRFEGRDVLSVSTEELRSIRGAEIAHVPQDPKKSLNPSIRVGEQIAETVKLHQDVSKREANRRAVEMLAEVDLSDPEYNARRYPHELSGGMQQRVLLAIALSCNPDLLVLDEPTTGLDVTTQAKILDLINELKRDYDTSIMLITHDLGVIAQVADRVHMLYAGETMERGTVRDVFGDPSNPYTQGLLAAIPEVDRRKDLRPIPGSIADLTDVGDGCVFADRCAFAEEACRTGDVAEEPVAPERGHYSRCRRIEAVREDPIRAELVDEPGSDEAAASERGERLLSLRNVRKYFGEETFFDRLFGGSPPVKAVDGVDLDVHGSETVGLVGESGSGKSTLGGTVLRLLELTDGEIRFRGEPIADLEGADLREFRSDCQAVFQNPHSSLNPRHRIRRIVGRPLTLFGDVEGEERDRRIGGILKRVGLPPEYASRYPHELSGGEKQRVAIARAFAANPAFVVLDEPVSALDVSVQASILNLLEMLRSEYGASYLFISHDLAVVNHIADRIAVMYLGHLVELGSTRAIFEPPYHPYTRALLSSNPSVDPDADGERIHLEGDVPSARDTPSGCPFHTRCPQKIGDVCETEVPELEAVEGSDDDAHRIACHLDEAEMSRETLASRAERESEGEGQGEGEADGEAAATDATLEAAADGTGEVNEEAVDD